MPQLMKKTIRPSPVFGIIPARLSDVVPSALAAPTCKLLPTMNEYGLFFDFAAASYDISKLKLKNPYKGFLMWEVLGKCRTVKEALAIIRKYDYDSPSQMLLAARGGASILIKPGRYCREKGNFQVNANCNMLNSQLACRRPEIVTEALSNLKENGILLLKGILNKTH